MVIILIIPNNTNNTSYAELVEDPTRICVSATHTFGGDEQGRCCWRDGLQGSLITRLPIYPSFLRAAIIFVDIITFNDNNNTMMMNTDVIKPSDDKKKNLESGSQVVVVVDDNNTDDDSDRKPHLSSSKLDPHEQQKNGDSYNNKLQNDRGVKINNKSAKLIKSAGANGVALQRWQILAKVRFCFIYLLYSVERVKYKENNETFLFYKNV